MNKYQTIIETLPPGVTHIDLERAESLVSRGDVSLIVRYCPMYRKNVEWYQFIRDDSDKWSRRYHAEYKNGVRKAFHLIKERPEGIVSIEGLKILARQFG